MRRHGLALASIVLSLLTMAWAIAGSSAVSALVIMGEGSMVQQTAPRRTQRLARYGAALLAVLVLVAGTVASFIEWSYGGEGPLDVWWFIWPPTWLLSSALALVSAWQARSGLTSALCWWAVDIPLLLSGVLLLERFGDTSLVSGLVFIVFFVIRATRSTGIGRTLFAWLGVCALATVGLFPVGVAFATVGVANIIGFAAALILIDVGVVYAGWRLIRNSVDVVDDISGTILRTELLS